MSHIPTVVYGPMVVPDTASVDKVNIVTEIFFPCFVKGNISRYYGCGKHNLRVLVLCVQHKEQVLYENPNISLYKVLSDLRNVCYHPSLACKV